MNFPPGQIKACVFDAFGTLFNLQIPFEQVDALAEGKGKALMDIWRNKQLEYTWLHSLMQDYQSFDVLTKKALSFAMQSQGISNPQLYDLLLPIYERADCFPQVPGVLQELKDRGIQCAILSNGTPKMLEAGATNAGIHPLLDTIFSVAQVGVFKPDPKVYQMVLEAWQLSKTELLFISSNQWDIAGAAQFGWTTVWLNQYNQVKEPFEPGAQLTITQLRELPLLF
ncbi:MAG: haloacid dehalogenase type II [Bacteroidota bacterium]